MCKRGCIFMMLNPLKFCDHQETKMIHHHTTRFHPSLPRGYSKRQLRRARKRWDMHGKLDIHHIVPRQMKRHPCIQRFGYDVEEDYNLIFCATRFGAQSLQLKSSRPIHDVHHSQYNDYVSQQLDASVDYSSFLVVLLTLHRICRGVINHTWR